ncbi:hypothetical protein PI124_g23241 [Phytophthora idaei]|nr:hypothetical protein PI125_g18522 [Phytophthora idaei]KAG3125583.1 hypothetical protein PI126_g22699 [Phytophthora idaei]KAG3231665.1 hypothetical protein PI124_g23241 [Phytophthora idaei]
MLRTLSPTEQHGVALGSIVKEQRDAAAATATTASSGTTPRVQSLKLHVSNYVGKEGEPLLRWLVEADTVIAARRIFDDPSKVAFAMSCLGGRARRWACGRRLTDTTCFGTCAEFKEELRQPFEPPKNEFRSRAEFLDLQQGKHDVHAYAQRAVLGLEHRDQPDGRGDQGRHVHEGLRDGPVKTYLFREYPSTLEAAITLAMQEEFSLRQAKLHVNVPRMARPVMRTGGPEAMDLPNATAAGHQQRNNSSVRCFRRGHTGHYACECTAAVHKAGGRCRASPRSIKKRAKPVGAGSPHGSAVTRVYNGHAALKTAGPSERDPHCKKQDGKPNLVILKIKSKRERTLFVRW